MVCHFIRNSLGEPPNGTGRHSGWHASNSVFNAVVDVGIHGRVKNANADI